MNVKILIVDDHEVVRNGVRGLLSKRGDWIVCGEASNGEEAIAAIKQLHPDLVVLDVSMPKMNGIEATRRIREDSLNPKILVFTMHESDGMLNEARRAGADGCVRKTQAGRDLIAAIDVVLSGGKFFPVSVRPDERKAVSAAN